MTNVASDVSAIVGFFVGEAVAQPKSQTGLGTTSAVVSSLAQISESKPMQSWVRKVAGGMPNTSQSTDRMWHLSGGHGGVRWHLGMYGRRIG